MICKNKTASKSTSSSVLTLEIVNYMPGHQFKQTKELLKTAKSATWEYKKEQSFHTQ